MTWTPQSIADVMQELAGLALEKKHPLQLDKMQQYPAWDALAQKMAKHEITNEKGEVTQPYKNVNVASLKRKYGDTMKLYYAKKEMLKQSGEARFEDVVTVKEWGSGDLCKETWGYCQTIEDVCNATVA